MTTSTMHCICPPNDNDGPLCHKDCPVHGLPKLCAPVADERVELPPLSAIDAEPSPHGPYEVYESEYVKEYARSAVLADRQQRAALTSAPVAEDSVSFEEWFNREYREAIARTDDLVSLFEERRTLRKGWDARAALASAPVAYDPTMQPSAANFPPEWTVGAPCYAADGKTLTYSVPGMPIMVRAVDFNTLWSSRQDSAPVADERAALLLKLQTASGVIWNSRSFQNGGPRVSVARKKWYDLGCIIDEARAALVANPQADERECGNADCGWSGKTYRMCGSVGPLCPECGETTEASAPVAGEAQITNTQAADFADKHGMYYDMDQAIAGGHARALLAAYAAPQATNERSK